ncbi:hypothetical protein L1049_017549 [Liquidambar formosana]|uniref:Early nodulin-75-like n=1 Tax=Liquidambar formosana TaxID=63359 RepID=A0AAP0S4G8_LIQFO
MHQQIKMSHTFLLVLLLGVLVVLTAPSLADFPKHPPEHKPPHHPGHPPVVENVEDTHKPPHHPKHPPVVENVEDSHKPPKGGKPPHHPGHPPVENEVGTTGAKKPPSPVKKPPHKPPSSN